MVFAMVLNPTHNLKARGMAYLSLMASREPINAIILPLNTLHGYLKVLKKQMDHYHHVSMELLSRITLTELTSDNFCISQTMYSSGSYVQVTSTIPLQWMHHCGLIKLFVANTESSNTQEMWMAVYQRLERGVGSIPLTGKSLNLTDHISWITRLLVTLKFVRTGSPLAQFMELATWHHSTSLLRPITWSSTGSNKFQSDQY